MPVVAEYTRVSILTQPLQSFMFIKRTLINVCERKKKKAHGTNFRVFCFFMPKKGAFQKKKEKKRVGGEVKIYIAIIPPRLDYI